MSYIIASRCLFKKPVYIAKKNGVLSVVKCKDDAAYSLYWDEGLEVTVEKVKSAFPQYSWAIQPIKNT